MIRYNEVIMSITWLALLSSIIGAWFVAILNPIGYVFWFIGNCIWLHFALERKDNPQIVLWIYYIITCIIGYMNLKWKFL